MLKSLHIRNMALIDEVELGFGAGLNILTGETGAGKSMIIDALSLILGGKAGRDIVRLGQDAASIAAVFSVPENLPLLKTLGIETENGELVISRQVSASGKSSARINGMPAPAATLRELGPGLVDIHGQHEHQSLLSQTKHITLLDKLAQTSLTPAKTHLASAIRSYREVSRRLDAITQGGNRERNLEMLQYQREELAAANLSPGLEEQLSNSRSVLLNTLRINELANGALSLLYEDESEELPALAQLIRSKNMMDELAKIDAQAAHFSESLNTLQLNLADLCQDLRTYAQKLPGDGAGTNEIDKIERHLDIIHNLKRKYGGSVEDAIRCLENIDAEIDNLSNSEEQLAQLGQDKKLLLKDISRLCSEISSIRTAYAESISKEVNAALADMGMANAIFEAHILRRPDFGANGFDRVEFMISPNLGEPLRPLAKIASGGEMSRVMLALKSVLVDTDDIGTFIFDEIDTGISGRTAQMVGEKLARLASGRQILCITHLPQIAAMADSHFLIEKHTQGGSTRTGVTKLTGDACFHELARLTGGAQITETTLAAAKEMKLFSKGAAYEH